MNIEHEHNAKVEYYMSPMIVILTFAIAMLLIISSTERVMRVLSISHSYAVAFQIMYIVLIVLVSYGLVYSLVTPSDTEKFLEAQSESPIIRQQPQSQLAEPSLSQSTSPILDSTELQSQSPVPVP